MSGILQDLLMLCVVVPNTEGLWADQLPSIVQDLLVILAAGFLVGVVCRKLGISVLVGYLAIGALLGQEVLGAVVDTEHNVEHFAQLGVFLLLFSIGLELSFDELARMGRWMALGGSLQMALVAAPIAAALSYWGLNWRAVVLLSLALSFSSTVLVFKALAEWGQVNSPHGKRAISILLFQDMALVPLLLIIPLIAPSEGGPPTFWEIVLLPLASFALIFAVVMLRWAIGEHLVPILAKLRSPELVVLFALTVLGGVTYGTYLAGLPPELGAFAAGLTLSSNRLSAQIDALILPFRESFAAIFFVSLGLLLDPMIFIQQAHILFPALLGILVLKSVAGAVAMLATRLSLRSSLAMGCGLSQVGEFALVISMVARTAGVITPEEYNLILSLSLGTLILTPLLLRYSLRWTDGSGYLEPEPHEKRDPADLVTEIAVVIGIGPVGRQVSSRLELIGMDVHLVDLSPVNLYQFAQQGFRTIAGDAGDAAVLNRADADRAKLVVVCIPDDQAALRCVRTLRELNATCRVIVRCRYVSNVHTLQKAGANEVISEEGQSSEAILRLLESHAPNAQELVKQHSG